MNILSRLDNRVSLQDRSEAKRSRLVNRLSLVATGYLAIRSLINIILGKYEYAGFQLGVAMLFATVIWLNRKGYSTFARHFLMFLTNFFVFIFSYFYFGGTSAGGQGLYIVFIMVPLVLFDVRKKKDIAAGIFLCLFFVSLLFYAGYAYPRQDTAGFGEFGVEITKVSVTILGMITAFLIVYFFHRLNQESENEILSAHEALEEGRRQLIRERNLLSQKNEQMQAELRVAKSVVERLLPAKMHADRAAWYFQPMNELGGDFIKIQYVDEAQKRMFVFLSDVSGHGVSSALITILLCNFLDTMELGKSTPSGILRAVSSQVSPYISGGFVTAFAGFIDFDKGVMIYANAGHPTPFIFSSGKVEKIPPDGRGLPLCVNTGNYGTGGTAGKGNYLDQEIRLSPGQTLFLFTDGMLEVTPQISPAEGERFRPDFESAGLDLFLKAAQNMEPAECVKSLVQRLRDYRGNSAFEDDICFAFIRI